MENEADAVATVLAHDGVVAGFGIALHGVADIAQACAGANLSYAFAHGLVRDPDQALRLHRNLAHGKHAAGVSVIAVPDYGDIDIDAIAVFQAFVPGDAVANHVIYRGAYAFWEALVIQRSRDAIQRVDHEFVADRVKFAGSHTCLDMLAYHVQDLGRQTSGNAHLVLFFGGFYRDIHMFWTGLKHLPS